LKKVWGFQTSDEPERVEPICCNRALQNGRSLSSPFPNTTRGLDGEIGSERCLPSGSKPPKLPQVPPVPMASEHVLFKCLPFELSAAPRVFTKLLKPVIGLLCQLGTRLIIYLDDILLFHQSKHQLEGPVAQIYQLFEALGLIINSKKSLLSPVQYLEF